MKARVLLLFLVLLLPASAPALTVKLGTLAPAGTPWDDALKKLAAMWSELSAGSVTLKIYPGAVAGNEQDMIRQMRFGQLQAGAITGDGLEVIVPDMIIPTLPFLFNSQSEIEEVLPQVLPEYKKEFADKGFVLLGWTVAGWINFFSRSPVVYPSDLQSQKLAVSGTNADVVQAWKLTGFHVVPLSTPDLMSGLSSGLIDALYTSPLAAAAYQWFGIANNMCALRMSPLLGGIIVTERTWNQIPQALRPQLEAAAVTVMKPLYADTHALELSAVSVMEKNGLTVNQVPPNAVARWRSLLATGYLPLKGKAFSAELYDKVIGLINAYRETHAN